MADPRPIWNAHMAKLVAGLGGVDAASAVLEARWGQGSKGTVSKKMAGQLAWTLDDMWALTEAAQDFSLRDWIGDSSPRAADRLCLTQGVSDLVREMGEAVPALLALQAAPGDARLRGRAVQEVGDVRAVADRLEDYLGGGV